MTNADAADLLAAKCRDLLELSGPAIRFNGGWTHWEEVARQAMSLESALDRAGLGDGARIAFAPRNSPRSLAAFCPLLARECAISMAYPFQSPDALARSLANLDVAAVVMETRDFSAPVIEVLKTRGIAGIALDEAGAHAVSGIEQPCGNALPSDPRIEILTSGTTGPPKHFPIGYDVVLGYVRQGEATARDGVPPTMLCFPLSNISGLYSLAMSFLRGAPTVLLEKFSVEEWLNYIREFRPASGGAPPAALAMILDRNVPVGDLSSLKVFMTGAAPVDPGVRQRFEERYGIPVLQTYGATEFGGPVCAMTTDLLAEFGSGKASSVGRPFGGARVRVRRADGNLAKIGEIGTVEVVSPRMGPDWIVTSDLGCLDVDGFLFLHGRADGAIMRGGFKIVPETVEMALIEHPAVAAASVVAVGDERLLEVPSAAVVVAGDVRPDVADLESHIRARLPATHVPVHWRFVGDLPRTVSFKVDRGAVRELFG